MAKLAENPNLPQAPNVRKTNIWIALLSLLILVIIVASLIVENHGSSYLTSMIQTNTYLAHEATKAHIEFEELLSGGGADIATVTGYFEKVDRYAEAMIESEKSQKELFLRSGDSDINRELLAVQAKALEFGNRARIKLEDENSQGSESEFYNKFHGTFNDLLLQTYELEVVLLEKMARGRRHLLLVEVLLGLTALLLLLFVGTLFRRHESKNRKLSHIMENSLLSTGRQLKNSNGDVLGAVVSMHNVSQSKLISEDLRRSEEKLKEAQKIAQLGHWELDIVANELKWSDEIYRIFQLEPQEFEATYDAFLNNIHPDDREEVNSAYSNSLIDKEPYEITHRLLLSDGSIKYVQEKCHTSYDENDNPVYSTGTVQDITARTLAEMKLDEYRVKLEEMVDSRTAELQVANKDLEDFAYSVSHDLKAPLRAISGFSEIISKRHRESLNEESQRYFEHIMNAGKSMNQLIEDLLSYSRLGRQSVEFQSVELDEIFQTMDSIFGNRIKDLNASLNVPENLPRVYGNTTLLTQIFTNLIDNALSYQRPDVVPQIDIHWRLENNYVIVSVTDNGIGIPDQFQEKVFHIFQRLHSDREKPGTGIGLAVVRKATSILGGSVLLDSTVGTGSIFQVKLKQGSEVKA